MGSIAKGLLFAFSTSAPVIHLPLLNFGWIRRFLCNGSGDFSNLVAANAFMELPLEITTFTAGSVYRMWPFKPIV